MKGLNLKINVLDEALCDRELRLKIESSWLRIGKKYNYFDSVYGSPKMNRRELSFHDEVKLLAYVGVATDSVPGDFLEIGVWKGKSLALIREFTSPVKKVIGIDPLSLPGQAEDFLYFFDSILAPLGDIKIIDDYSERALSKVLKLTTTLSAIHIDGGHGINNVLTDFILYQGFLSIGGVIVFDDYRDSVHSPEVKPAVDFIVAHLLQDRYSVVGTLEEFPNPFVIVRTS